MNCQRKGCLSQATSAIAINIPATGIPIAEHDPIIIAIGLCLCDRCFAETEPSELLDSAGKLKDVVINLTRKTGRLPPDFDRAFLSRVGFDDPSYIRLKTKNG